MVDIHKAVGCKPELIDSKTVYGSYNDGASVDNLKWETSDGRSKNIVANACDYHKCNTSAGQDSGTSSYRRNINPELGTTLNKIHDWLTKIIHNIQHTAVLINAQK